MERAKINRPADLFGEFISSTYDAEEGERTSEQLRADADELTDRMVRMAELMAADTPADDPAVLNEIDWYYRSARRYGVSDAALFTCLGQMCVEDRELNALFESVADGLAAYHNNAIAAYSRARLG